MSPGADVLVHLAPPGSHATLDRVLDGIQVQLERVEPARARTCEEAVCLLRWHHVVAVVVSLPFPGLASDRIVTRLREATAVPIVAVSEVWTADDERAIRAAGALLCLTPDQVGELRRVVEHSVARAASRR